jgi:HAD superfamily hydrolase (TIGR01509 family)
MQAVLFDLWETLITDPRELGRARQLWRAANVGAVLEAAGLDADPDRIEQALDATSRAVSLQHDQGIDTDADGRVQILLAELEKHGAATPPERAHAALEQAICTIPEDLYPRLMADAVETLTALRGRGLKLGLISNAGVTTAPTLRAMLDHYGLLHLLDLQLFSDEAQLAKPSLALFQTALKALDCKAAEAVFVGDSPAHDVVGAHAAGMRAIVIGRKEVEGITPDARIEDLGGLLDVIAALDPA